MIVVDESKFIAYHEAVMDKNGFVREMIIIKDKNGNIIFQVPYAVDVVQIGPAADEKFVFIQKTSSAYKFNFIDSSGYTRNDVSMPSCIDNRFFTLYREVKDRTEEKSFVLYDALLGIDVNIPIADCTKIVVKKADYTIDNINCIEVSTVVKLKNVSDILTYIFDAYELACIGVSSKELDKYFDFIEDCNFISTGDMYYETYLPLLKQLDQVIEGEVSDLPNSNLQLRKKLGSRYMSI